MPNVMEREISGVTFAIDMDRQKAYIVDKDGNVRFVLVKDGKCANAASGRVAKTDKRRGDDEQDAIDAIWAILRTKGVKRYTGQLGR